MFNTGTHEALEDADRSLGAIEVPHLDTALPTRVHKLGGIADGDSTHHLTMVELVHLGGKREAFSVSYLFFFIIIIIFFRLVHLERGTIFFCYQYNNFFLHKK